MKLIYFCLGIFLVGNDAFAMHTDTSGATEEESQLLVSGDEECPICLVALSDERKFVDNSWLLGGRVVQMQCGHLIHTNCFILLVRFDHEFCPLCRKQMTGDGRKIETTHAAGSREERRRALLAWIEAESRERSTCVNCCAIC